MTLEIGKTYKINHSRKGVFEGKVVGFDDVWVQVLITSGYTQAILAHNERQRGDTISIRESFCTFEPL